MTFVWNVCDLDLKAMPQLEDGAEKNFRPIYTIMLNINETNKRVFIKYSYINLDAIFFFYFYMKFLSLWPWSQGHTPG